MQITCTATSATSTSNNLEQMNPTRGAHAEPKALNVLLVAPPLPDAVMDLINGYPSQDL